MTNTPVMLRAMARQMTALGVRPEIEAFDTGHLWFAKQLAAEGLIEDPVLVQLCMGVPWGAPDDLNTFMAMVNNVPAGWIWSAFSIGRNADGLCGCGGARRRQCPRRAGGQPLCSARASSRPTRNSSRGPPAS